VGEYFKLRSYLGGIGHLSVLPQSQVHWNSAKVLGHTQDEKERFSYQSPILTYLFATLFEYLFSEANLIKGSYSKEIFPTDLKFATIPTLFPVLPTKIGYFFVRRFDHLLNQITLLAS
jgi:hypothetical protein